MKRLLACIALASSPAMATDYLYVYYPTGNVTYECVKLPSYLTTEENSRLAFAQCEVQVIDYATWPVFPFLPVKLTMTGPAFKVPNVRHCSFVAQANGSVDTSHVVDCR